MRYFYLILVIVFAAVITIFAVQNFQAVDVSFLRLRFHVPLSILTVGIYVLGALTGGGVLAFLRHAWDRSELSK
jgi:lipopolysaccharide assembly protein A